MQQQTKLLQNKSLVLVAKPHIALGAAGYI